MGFLLVELLGFVIFLSELEFEFLMARIVLASSILSQTQDSRAGLACFGHLRPYSRESHKNFKIPGSEAS